MDLYGEDPPLDREWTPAIIIEATGLQRVAETRCRLRFDRALCDCESSAECVSYAWAASSRGEIASAFPIVKSAERSIVTSFADLTDDSGFATRGDGSTDLLIICNHPAYDHLRRTTPMRWAGCACCQARRESQDRSEPIAPRCGGEAGVIEDSRNSASFLQFETDAVDPGLPQPSNDRLAFLIRRRIRIVGTLVVDAPLDRRSDDKRCSACQKWKRGYIEYHTLSPFHIYDRRAWPRKNVGELKFLTLPDAYPRPEIVFPPRAGLEIPIIAIDGIIGAGKTTKMKQMERTAVDWHFEYENTGAIYDTIQQCQEQGIIGTDRRKRIEETVFQHERSFLLDLPALAAGAYIERNWIYSRWVFGEYSDPFPRVDPKLEFYLSRSRARFDGTMVVWTDPETAIQRVKARGTRDEVDVAFECELERRLRILFDSPYEWAYGKVLDGPPSGR